MTSKPVLMIHQITEEMFSLPLENYILTFDDGLYGHYYYFEQVKKIPTEKIYFISTAFVNNGHQSTKFPTSVEAHAKAKSGNYEDFISLDQLEEMLYTPNVSIGGHGHNHVSLDSMRSLYEMVNSMSTDTNAMMQWFGANLNIAPTKFCYPYNNDVNGVYTAMLKKFGLTEFYGSERIPVETLLRTQVQPASL